MFTNICFFDTLPTNHRHCCHDVHCYHTVVKSLEQMWATTLDSTWCSTQSHGKPMELHISTYVNTELKLDTWDSMSIYVRFKDSLSYSDRFFVFTCSMKVASHAFFRFPQSDDSQQNLGSEFWGLSFRLHPHFWGSQKSSQVTKYVPINWPWLTKKTQHGPWTSSLWKGNSSSKIQKKPSFLGSILIFGGM